jgi:tetratricopeptide (TPR) repeat protein
MREYQQSRLEGYQVQWLQCLLRAKQYDRLRDELGALPKSMWETQQASLVPIQLRLEAQSGALDRILDSYRTDPEHAPASEVLRKATTELQQAGDKQSARKILEFVFAREIENHNLTAANMLGLADIRIQSGDLEGGVSLLRRMTLVVGNPFETQDPAAALLIRAGHPAEAVTFLEELVKAMPWNPDYRVRLAQARVAANQNAEDGKRELASVAASGDVPYDTRLAAAKALARSGAGNDLGSKELNLIAGTQAVSAADANQPFFFTARLKAAESLPAGGRIALLRGALEDNPKGDEARVPLMKAAIETGDFHLAIAAMKPYLQSGAFEAALGRRRNLDEEEDNQLEQESTTDVTPPGLMKLPAKERAEISRDLGLAFDRTNSLDQALVYLRRAYRIEADPATKTQINKEVQQIRAVQRRRATNQARRPVIQSQLEQSHVVRPRVPEPATPGPPKPRAPAGKGASQ